MGELDTRSPNELMDALRALVADVKEVKREMEGGVRLELVSPELEEIILYAIATKILLTEFPLNSEALYKMDGNWYFLM